MTVYISPKYIRCTYACLYCQCEGRLWSGFFPLNIRGGFLWQNLEAILTRPKEGNTLNNWPHLIRPSSRSIWLFICHFCEPFWGKSSLNSSVFPPWRWRLRPQKSEKRGEDGQSRYGKQTKCPHSTLRSGPIAMAMLVDTLGPNSTTVQKARSLLYLITSPQGLTR